MLLFFDLAVTRDLDSFAVSTKWRIKRNDLTFSVQLFYSTFACQKLISIV